MKWYYRQCLFKVKSILALSLCPEVAPTLNSQIGPMEMFRGWTDYTAVFFFQIL